MSTHQISKDEKPKWIDDTVEGKVYLGYPSHYKVEEDEPLTGIELIDSTGTGTTIKHPDNSRKKVFRWDQRIDLDEEDFYK